jgi:23S rRNA (cytosine1962-C5)-methyltransferase
VTVVDHTGAFVGRGFYNPRTSLACRIFTRVDEPLDAAFFRRRVATAVAYRQTLDMAADARRLVWSEADGLPGAVVDRYADVLVMQCLTAAMDAARATLADALRDVVGELPIYLLDDPGAARLEGFEPRRGWLERTGDEAVTVREGALRFVVTLGEGHKTGTYLDQAENRPLVARRARDVEVLDAFCYTGGFAAHALAAGATRATCIDSSADALAAALANLELNGLAGRAELRDANAFDELRRLERSGARFGLIVLDPPPFTRTRTAVAAALRGYKEINLRALRLLSPGGTLATFSCSHHVSAALFEEICREAAADAGVPVRVLSTLTQSRDHPVLLTVPETHYLKGLLLEAP